MIAKVLPIRLGVDALPARGDISCSNSLWENFHRALLRIVSEDGKMTGDDIGELFDASKWEISRILAFLDDVSIDKARRRSVWMIAWFYDEIVCLHVPQHFLPKFEIEQRELDRTKAYAFYRAYLLSKEIAYEYLKIHDLMNFYAELPNLVIACQHLHDLWVSPSMLITSWSQYDSFLTEAAEYRKHVLNGIQWFYIKKTPAITEILHPNIGQVK